MLGGHLVSNGQAGKAKKETSRKEETREHGQFLALKNSDLSLGC